MYLYTWHEYSEDIHFGDLRLYALKKLAIAPLLEIAYTVNVARHSA